MARIRLMNLPLRHTEMLRLRRDSIPKRRANSKPVWCGELENISQGDRAHGRKIAQVTACQHQRVPDSTPADLSGFRHLASRRRSRSSPWLRRRPGTPFRAPHLLMKSCGVMAQSIQIARLMSVFSCRGPPRPAPDNRKRSAHAPCRSVPGWSAGSRCGHPDRICATRRRVR